MTSTDHKKNHHSQKRMPKVSKMTIKRMRTPGREWAQNNDSRMWSLRHCRCVMWIRCMFHVLCFCIYMSYSHPESYRTIIACATAKSCFWFFVGSKTLFSGCCLSVFYWIFALFVSVILGNEKSLCYKYRTSIFRYLWTVWTVRYCYITAPNI